MTKFFEGLINKGLSWLKVKTKKVFFAIMLLLGAAQVVLTQGLAVDIFPENDLWTTILKYVTFFSAAFITVAQTGSTGNNSPP